MRQKLKHSILDKFNEEIRFFKGWMRSPKTVGSVFPTSFRAARVMASVIDTSSKLPVLELGPGTGVVTRAILDRGVPADKLISVEYSERFVTALRESFPDVHFHHGDAFNLAPVLKNEDIQMFDCIISCIPLLSFKNEMRVKLIKSLLDLIPAGRPIVQMSYGPFSPLVANQDCYTIKHLKWVARNIPPVQLWCYSR